MTDEQHPPYGPDEYCHLCVGNDEHPRGHTSDCGFSIDRYIAIEIAARQVLERPTNKAALRRLKKALEPVPFPVKE